MNNKRELILRLEDAEAATIKAINQIIQIYNIPLFLFEPIIDKVYRQVLNGKKDELLSAKMREDVAQSTDIPVEENPDGEIEQQPA